MNHREKKVFPLKTWPAYPKKICPLKKWPVDHPANENELDEPMGILPPPHIRSGHTTHHRGPINLSSQLSPPSYILPFFWFPPYLLLLFYTCLSQYSYSSWSSGDGCIPCLLPHIRCNGFWSRALLCSPLRWLPHIYLPYVIKQNINPIFLSKHYSRDPPLLLSSLYPPGQTISSQLCRTQVMWECKSV